MSVGYPVKAMSWSSKAVIAAVLLAVLLVAAVPVTLLVGVVMVLLGHVVGAFALFGASILAAAVAIVVASLSGVRQLRKLVSQHGYRVIRLPRSEYYR